MPTTKEFKLHTIPKDLKEVLKNRADVAKVWQTLTPLTQNEWICWLTIVKKEETRTEHLLRLQSDLTTGTRRPCCWPGCPHRRPNAQKYFWGSKKSK